MKPLIKKLIISGFVVASGFGPISGICAESDENVFEAKLFQTIEISSFTINPEKFKSLTVEDKNDLLMAKDVLMKFFKSLEDSEGNSKQYLSPKFLSGRKLDHQDIRNEVISDESDILKIGITNFDFKSGRKSIEFNFYAISFVEGAFSLGEGNAHLDKLSGSWKISKIIISKP